MSPKPLIRSDAVFKANRTLCCQGLVTQNEYSKYDIPFDGVF